MKCTKYQGIKPSQHGFIKGRSCLTKLLSFCDRMTHLGMEGNVCLGFNKAFDLISHSLLSEKLVAWVLDRHILHWVKIWPDGCVQEFVWS